MNLIAEELIKKVRELLKCAKWDELDSKAHKYFSEIANSIVDELIKTEFPEVRKMVFVVPGLNVRDNTKAYVARESREAAFILLNVVWFLRDPDHEQLRRTLFHELVHIKTGLSHPDPRLERELELRGYPRGT
jgi:hypothetical protein